jgi:hypothetical protein
LVVRSIKTGRAYIFSTDGATDQKVTVSALNAVVVKVVECVKMLLGADGGCVPAGTPTLKSVEIRE